MKKAFFICICLVLSMHGLQATDCKINVKPSEEIAEACSKACHEGYAWNGIAYAVNDGWYSKKGGERSYRCGCAYADSRAFFHLACKE